MKLTDNQMFAEFLINMHLQGKLTKEQSFKSINNVWFQIFQYELGYKRLMENTKEVKDD